MPFIEYDKPVNRCNHPEHDPPKMIVLKPGRHIWECPACKATQVINVPEIRCDIDSTVRPWWKPFPPEGLERSGGWRQADHQLTLFR